MQSLFGAAADADADSTALSGPADEPGDSAEIDQRRQRVEGQALLEKAERLLQNASAADADDLVNAIETVKDALAGDTADTAALKASMDLLADLLYYLEV